MKKTSPSVPIEALNPHSTAMKIFYCDHFVLPLPSEHRFPMLKYAMLRERVGQANLVLPQNLSEPPAATDEQLLRVHSQVYLEKVKNGTLSQAEVRRMGFPWSLGLVERSRRSVGGTIAASRNALRDGMAVNLAGGTHHAGRDHGEGFCVFNDVVVAARTMQIEEGLGHILILDCDVHQGNGTAALCMNDSTIFTFSIHGQKNFPFRKVSSDLDIGLPDGTTDAEYLEVLELGLLQVLSLAHADLVIYLSGADAFAGDRLGRLALTKAGMLARDKLVYANCRSMGLPIATVMGGGYAPNLDDIVDIHFQTVSLAASFVSG